MQSFERLDGSELCFCFGYTSPTIGYRGSNSILRNAGKDLAIDLKGGWAIKLYVNRMSLQNRYNTRGFDMISLENRREQQKSPEL